MQPLQGVAVPEVKGPVGGGGEQQAAVGKRCPPDRVRGASRCSEDLGGELAVLFGPDVRPAGPGGAGGGPVPAGPAPVGDHERDGGPPGGGGVNGLPGRGVPDVQYPTAATGRQPG